jgi:hypothetical protein
MAPDSKRRPGLQEKARTSREGKEMKTTNRFLSALILLVLASGLATATPIVSLIDTNDYDATVSLFEGPTSFIAAARYAPNNFKIRIDGDPDGRVTGGNGISWNTGGPQPFTLSFDGTTLTFSVVDDGTTHTVSAQPVDPAVNTIIVMLRNQAVPNRSARTLGVSNLAFNGMTLAIGGISMGYETSNVSMMIQNTGKSFTLTGNLSILGTGPGGDERPIINFFGGTTKFPQGLGDQSLAGESAVPEPGTMLLSLAGLALIYGGRKRLLQSR